jgi:hypothetical protein
MPLIDAKLHLLFWLVKFAGLLLRLQLADNFLKDFGRGETTASFETLDVQFNFAGSTDGDFKFALWHKALE